jgi:hypothetical protein
MPCVPPTLHLPAPCTLQAAPKAKAAPRRRRRKYGSSGDEWSEEEADSRAGGAAEQAQQAPCAQDAPPRQRARHAAAAAEPLNTRPPPAQLHPQASGMQCAAPPAAPAAPTLREIEGQLRAGDAAEQLEPLLDAPRGMPASPPLYLALHTPRSAALPGYSGGATAGRGGGDIFSPGTTLGAFFSPGAGRPDRRSLPSASPAKRPVGPSCADGAAVESVHQEGAAGRGYEVHQFRAAAAANDHGAQGGRAVDGGRAQWQPAAASASPQRR